MTDMAEFARTLWIEARPMVVVQATEAVEAAEAWAATGDSASWGNTSIMPPRTLA